jgi:L-amino acid N-acyltransferase YncA
MIVRPAIPDDAARIAAIWNVFIRDTAVTFTTAEKTVARLAADITARGPAFQVVEIAGQVEGFATYFPFRNGPGYARTKEHSVLLAPAAQGRGAGRAVMGALLDAARADGVHSIFAGVSGENPAGVAFHAALGFREIARLPQVGFKFGRWMDLVLMQRML